MILPLAQRAATRRTQVRWGIRPIRASLRTRSPRGCGCRRRRSTRDARGAGGGGHRASRSSSRTRRAGVRELGGATGDPAAALDPRRPTAGKLAGRPSIALFFYDGPISRAVAFERLLARGERFAHRLPRPASTRPPTHPQLVNIATDGETYGHHHRFGEMALAYALRSIEASGVATLTNYGEFLARAPADDARSRSSRHVVELRARRRALARRLRLPGRAPPRLEPAVARAAARGARLAARQRGPALRGPGGRAAHDPWAARDDYIDVSPRSLRATVDGLPRPARAPPAGCQTAESTLGLPRDAAQRMLMYTCCGWFFDEISGIETVQVLQYAARAMQLARALGGERGSRTSSFVASGPLRRTSRSSGTAPGVATPRGALRDRPGARRRALRDRGAHRGLWRSWPRSTRSAWSGVSGPR